MKKCLLILSLLILILSNSCKKTESQLNIDPNDELSFSGSFKTINSENLSGTILLGISDGYYGCLTNLPFGHGAGKLEADETTIVFIDTSFFAIPAIYGPSYVLSGKYNYLYNGEKLQIWKKENVGEIMYELKLVKTN